MLSVLAGDQRSQRSDGAHYAPADGIRAGAIALVFLDHILLRFPNAGAGPVTALALAAGGFGVAALFLLSGFLLSGPYLRYAIDGAPFPSVSIYARGRFLRIYPLYAVAVVLIGAFVALFERHTAHLGLWDFVSHLTFLHDLERSTVVSISSVFWTMAVDAGFYVCLPLAALALAAAFGRAPRERRLALTVFALGAVVVLSIVYRAVAAATTHPQDAADIVVAVRNLAGMAGLFAFGIGAQLVFREAPARAHVRRARGAIAAAGIAAAIAFFFLRVAYLHAGGAARVAVLGIDDIVGGVSALALLLLVTACAEMPLARFLSSRVMVAAAALSYAFYLFHPTVVTVCEEITNRMLPRVLHGAPAFAAYAVTVVSAVVVLVPLCVVAHLGVERPFLRRKAQLKREAGADGAAARSGPVPNPT